MAERRKTCNLLFMLAVAGFGGAASMYLFRQFLAVGMLKSVSEATLYILIAAATLVLSYALFIKASQNHARDPIHSRS